MLIKLIGLLKLPKKMYTAFTLITIKKVKYEYRNLSPLPLIKTEKHFEHNDKQALKYETIFIKLE